ncbi:MFS transporter [Kroppenstedtia eburnea]|uniref:MFS transporter n=1 Tax=Kroppenstedtia eburnea TaxID=714067 RepID=UPI00363F2701
MKEKRIQNKVLVLYLLSIGTFFASLNQNIYSPVIPLIRDSFGVSVNWVNFTVSSFIFITAVMQIILGTFIDSKNQKRLLMASLIITSISTLVCAFSTQFLVFMIFRMAQAIGTAMIPLVAVNMIAQLFEGEERGNAMGTYQILLTLAPAVAPILGGVLGQYYGYMGIFLSLFFLSIMLLILLGYFLPEEQTKNSSAKSYHIKEKYVSVFSNPTGTGTMILGFFMFLIYFAVLVYLPVLLNDYYRVSLQVIGMLYLPLTLSMILGSLLFKRMQKKMSLQSLFIAVLICMPVQVMLFGILHEQTIIGLSIVLFVYGLTVGFSPPLLVTLISNEYQEHRGTALGLFNFVRYFGMALGAMIAGLYKVIPVSSLFILLGALLGLIVAFQYRFMKKNRC